MPIGSFIARIGRFVTPVFLVFIVSPAPAQQPSTTSTPASKVKGQSEGLYGSSSCRPCHESFYQKWAGSFHGLAMQPFTVELARTKLIPQKESILIKDVRYRACVEDGQDWVLEDNPNGQRKYRIEHVMGGKNVYYFLTPLDRGRLQVLPVAYDVRRKAWLDTTGSAVRHFGDRRDEPLDWREPPLTFNTSCFGCHVSQLSTNYDLKTDTYKTTWAEPGINCETCHGPGDEHVRLFQLTTTDRKIDDIRILSTKKLSIEQTNTMCAPCHAKMAVVTTDFKPGDRYFDHYDLVTFEDPDFYPDGRDLGENYTYTSWRMNPCARSGKLSCMHCHTSSGRYRFEGDQANQACMPCHRDKVEDAAVHIHHPKGRGPARCVQCHAPMTEFARMRRTDHSMRPPAPAATLAFKSPNACNHCHDDKDAAWADNNVRQWRSRDYQAPILVQGRLIEAGRKEDWTRLPDMLAYLANPQRNEIVANSLIRLMRTCEDERKWPALIQAVQDPSPLIRASASDGLSGHFTPEAVKALVAATHDDYRLVRVRAAGSLAGVPAEMLNNTDREHVETATAEFLRVMLARPDDHASHYNLGNFHANRHEYDQAIACFETSTRLRPDSIPPLVNISLAYNAVGQNDKAEASLRQALKVDPANAAANLNLGLLSAEMGRMGQAEAALRTAYKADPRSAVAAYNLAILVAQDRPDEAMEWCRKAADLRPQEPRYAYTMAFYQGQRGELAEAVATLRRLIQQFPAYVDAYALLGEIYEEMHQPQEALDTYRKAIALDDLSEDLRARFEARIAVLSSR